MPRAIAAETYKQFARKCKIPLQRGGKARTIAELSRAIYQHEKRLNDAGKLRSPGLYFV